MKKLLLLLSLFLLFNTQAKSEGVSPAPLEITTESGTPDTYPYKVKFTNGSVTDNGDGTTSISVLTPASGNSLYLKLNQSTPQDVINGAPTFNAGIDLGLNTTIGFPANIARDMTGMSVGGTTYQALYLKVRGKNVFYITEFTNALQIGNATNNPSFEFMGTGNITLDPLSGSTGFVKGTAGLLSIDTATYIPTTVMTTLGDIIYGAVSGSATRLAGNTTTVPKFLSQTGDGSNSAAPSWQPLPVSGLLTFFFIDTTSGITQSGTTYKLQPSINNYTPATKAQLTTTVNNGGVVAGWITPSGFPNVNLIADGVFHFHIHASRNSGASENITIHPVVYSRTTGGTETLICTGEDTSILTTSEVEYDLAAVLTQPVTIGLTDRIVVKWVATSIGSKDVTLYYDGTGVNETFCRMEMPTAAVDASSFVPYTGATADVDLGTTHNLTAYRLISTDGTRSLSSDFDTNTMFFGTTSYTHLGLQANGTTMVYLGRNGVLQFPLLTDNGFLKTSGGNGQVGVDTTTYAPQNISPASSGGTTTGPTITLTSTETQAVGDAVNIDSNGKAHLAKADAIANANAVLIAAGAVTGSASNTYLLPNGTVKLASSPSWTIGGLVYLSTTGTTGNTLTQSAPSGANNVIQVLGVAVSGDTLLFTPIHQVEHN